MPPRSYPHIPPGRVEGPLSRDHPITRGALPSLMSPMLKGVTVSLPRTEYRRGEAVEPSIAPAGEHADAQVGLVCHERWLDRRNEYGPQLRMETEWEEWRPLAHDTASFAIPRDAPYSHEGTVYAISWVVVVRAPRRLRADATLSTPIWVNP